MPFSYPVVIRRRASVDTVQFPPKPPSLLSALVEMAGKSVRGLNEALRALSLSSQTCREAASVRRHHHSHHHGLPSRRTQG